MPTSSANRAADGSRPGLEVSGLVVGYGSTTIVHGVSLMAAPGQVVGIVGPNGAGKSTLLKAVAGAIPAKAGTVRLDGQDVTNLRGDRLAHLGLSYVPQVKDVFSPLKVQENLELGGYTLPRRKVPERIEEVFALLPMLKALRRRTAGTLSGGERKLLAIGKALMTRPRILLFDEPTANLSPDLARVVLTEHVRRLADDGIGIVLVEQRVVQGLKVCDWAYVMAAGLTQLSGPAPEILANEDIGALFLGRRPVAPKAAAPGNVTPGSAVSGDVAPPTPQTPVQ
jgi:ABC-type branched-subunit amino acid transport system ATPase component